MHLITPHIGRQHPMCAVRIRVQNVCTCTERMQMYVCRTYVDVRVQNVCRCTYAERMQMYMYIYIEVLFSCSVVGVV